MINNTHAAARTALLITLGLAVVWIVAAAWRPTSTYHLAPVLLVGSGPLMVWGSPQDALRAAGFGTAAALGTSVLLAWLNLLRGPSLLPFGGALTESVVFTAMTAVAVVAIALPPVGRSAQ